MPTAYQILAAARAAKARRIANVESMRCCWPEWHGPAVSDDIHGLCQVGEVCCYDETEGRVCYHYSEPARIIEMLDGGNTIRAQLIDSEDPVGNPDATPRIVRLDLSEIWPPVDELWKLRNATSSTAH
jgi:hypothetical protein